jgi:hypothetical protein
VSLRSEQFRLPNVSRRIHQSCLSKLRYETQFDHLFSRLSFVFDDKNDPGISAPVKNLYMVLCDLSTLTDNAKLLNWFEQQDPGTQAEAIALEQSQNQYLQAPFDHYYLEFTRLIESHLRTMKRVSQKRGRSARLRYPVFLKVADSRFIALASPVLGLQVPLVARIAQGVTRTAPSLSGRCCYVHHGTTRLDLLVDQPLPLALRISSPKWRTITSLDQVCLLDRAFLVLGLVSRFSSTIFRQPISVSIFDLLLLGSSFAVLTCCIALSSFSDQPSISRSYSARSRPRISSTQLTSSAHVASPGSLGYDTYRSKIGSTKLFPFPKLITH